jgi:O-antigen biosynthesis protein
MTSGINEGKKDLLGQLAETYIRGKGIEIADAPRPFPVPPGVCIRRVDESALAKGERCIGTHDKTLENLDFCIARHIFQDAGELRAFLHQCLLMLRPGGMLVVTVPCKSDPPGRLERLSGHFFSRDTPTPLKDPEESIRNIVNGETVLTLPVRIRWQGAYDNAGPREYVFVIERFDYVMQIQELLQKKRDTMEIQPGRVDVIIPVYNAHDDFLRCLHSVMVHHENERIICIDDKSTDTRIGSVFSSLEPYQSSWFVLIRQEINRGFAATVNRGMRHSRNDIILLNSDTIVTKSWTKKLQEGVRSVKNCGTMTPLSNNGTLCSVPVMMENNLLPPGVSIDDYADMVEKISFGQFPVIPAGVGFCLYISRACLDTTGYFDEARYHAGYGEETDFCLRARTAGLTHHVCDTTFIYHRGMASFSTQAMRRLQEGIAALDARYPSYQEEISGFIHDNPLSEIQENIACRAVTWDFSGTASRILFMTESGGRDGFDRQAEGSGDTGMYYLLRRTPSEYCLSEYNRGNRLDYSFPLDAASAEPVPEIIEKILCSFRITRIQLDHADSRISPVAAKFHIPCRVSSFSAGTATGKDTGTARAPFMKPGDTCSPGLLDDQTSFSPLHERQEPDRGSGRQFSSQEIFHRIRTFPEARFRGVIPFRPEQSGSLPARLRRCLTENGILFTLQRIGSLIMHGKEGDS